MPTIAIPPTIAYNATLNPNIAGSGRVMNSLTGLTPDTPFTLPAAGGSGLQISLAHDLSPITVVAGWNSSAKGAAVVLVKNSVVQQSIGVTGVSPPRVFNPLVIGNGDNVEIQGN